MPCQLAHLVLCNPKEWIFNISLIVSQPECLFTWHHAAIWFPPSPRWPICVGSNLNNPPRKLMWMRYCLAFPRLTLSEWPAILLISLLEATSHSCTVPSLLPTPKTLPWSKEQFYKRCQNIFKSNLGDPRDRGDVLFFTFPLTKLDNASIRCVPNVNSSGQRHLTGVLNSRTRKLIGLTATWLRLLQSIRWR